LASLDAKPFIRQASKDTPAPVPGNVTKERLACAEIGLEPKAAAFATCVEGLKAVTSARFLEDLYR
jgi:hypothetical protein